MSTQEQVLKQMAMLPEAAQHQVLEFVQALLGQQMGASNQEHEQALRQLIREREAAYDSNPKQARPAAESDAELKARFGW
ncbi:MAG: hypothetical protein AAFQ98_16455 [Bacteroidota bacterium]